VVEFKMAASEAVSSISAAAMSVNGIAELVAPTIKNSFQRDRNLGMPRARRTA
jgi:hypothetical protein